MSDDELPRVLVWFSAGIASATAASLALKKYPSNRVHLLYCDTSASETEDNVRFIAEVEKWLGHPIEKIASTLYANIDEVFERTRYLAGVSGARCTVEMKKVPRFRYQRPDDIHVFGFHLGEEARIARFRAANPELVCDWILSGEGYDRKACIATITAAGIEMPLLYRQGFKNNNCIGCVKATSLDYWAKVRRLYPEVFARRARQSRDLGVRLTRLRGRRIFIDEIPLEYSGEKPVRENVSCGPECRGGAK